jgi:hypothetical protein
MKYLVYIYKSINQYLVRQQQATTPSDINWQRKKGQKVRSQIG